MRDWQSEARERKRERNKARWRAEAAEKRVERLKDENRILKEMVAGLSRELTSLVRRMNQLLRRGDEEEL